MEGQKILVTGPTGHLTAPLVRELAADNDVWGMARFSDPGQRSELEALGVTCVKKDLAVDRFDDLPDDFDYVFHAGAMVAMDSEKDMAHTFEVQARFGNVQGDPVEIDGRMPVRIQTKMRPGGTFIAHRVVSCCRSR